MPDAVPTSVSDDVLSMLRDSLAAHREMVLGASRSNAELDVVGALQVHAGLGNIMASWSDYTAAQQREIVRTITYLIEDDDESPDLQGPDGFADDLVQLRALQSFLG